MAVLNTDKARIEAVSLTTGSIKLSIDEDPVLAAYPEARRERLKKALGLNERYVAEEATTTLDLCEDAARQVFDLNQTDLASIDGLIFITQTPDYFQPGNAHLLHGRLGLSRDCVCFNLSEGCAGWVHGYYLASLLIEAGNCQRVLLCAGDTLHRTVNPKDGVMYPLFGDGGSASLVGRTASPCPTCFSLHSDGSGAAAIRHAGPGFRHRSDPNLLAITTDEEGNERSLNDFQMDGAGVFNFSLREEPTALKEILEMAGKTSDEVDWVLLHQANQYIVENIRRRTGFPPEKVPSDIIGKFGNLSSASIPSILADRSEAMQSPASQTRIYSGFGVGLSWATALSVAPPFPTSWRPLKATPSC
jgi:3-oxoacyl-[acyl-carrier-protein] synthase-3